MNFCRKDLSSRDECRVLTAQCENTRNHLLELALLDLGLTGNKHFFNAMAALIEASSEIAQLRACASPSFMGELEEHKHFPTRIETGVA